MNTKYDKDSKKKIIINKLFIINFFVSIIFCFIIASMFNKDATIIDIKYFSYLALFMLVYQITILVKNGCSIHSFEIWFIIMSYLFMFGQIFLVGIFDLKKIEALGHVRPILDERYLLSIIYSSSLFVLLCIHFIFSAFIYSNKKSFKNIKIKACDYNLYKTAIIMLVIGIPCHLIYSFRMITAAQTYGSYDAIVDYTGLVDDFSNFMIYGLICLIFSGKLKKNKCKWILLFVSVYLLLVMIMTGDRRYQIVSIITLLLSYIKMYNINIVSSLKSLIIAVSSYFVLGIFYLIREIRTSSLTNIVAFFDMYKKVLFDAKTNILSQTLYEFGNSIYTVCLAFKYVPNVINYKYGSTILSGFISIIPLGFIYTKSDIYLRGRLASELMIAGNTTVGGSVFADFYGNFGLLFGIVCSLILGIILNCSFYKKQKKDKGNNYYLARYYILFFALLHLVRASFTEVIRTSVWGIILLTLLYSIIWTKDNESI